MCVNIESVINTLIFFTVEGIPGGEGTPHRTRKQLNLPVLPLQPKNPDDNEIESKLQEEIMKMNGILNINGKVSFEIRYNISWYYKMSKS